MPATLLESFGPVPHLPMLRFGKRRASLGRYRKYEIPERKEHAKCFKANFLECPDVSYVGMKIRA